MDAGRVNSFEASCIVPDDPGEVVRGARPLTAEDVVRLREQMIVRLTTEAAAGGSQTRRPRDLDERVRHAMRGWRASRPTRGGQQ